VVLVVLVGVLVVLRLLLVVRVMVRGDFGSH
jgi:hypothetical protein